MNPSVLSLVFVASLALSGIITSSALAATVTLDGRVLPRVYLRCLPTSLTAEGGGKKRLLTYCLRCEDVVVPSAP